MFEHTEEKALDRIAAEVWRRIQPLLENWDGKPAARTMTTKAAADYLGLSVSAVEHLKYRGVLPCVKINRRNMYDRVALDRLIEGKQRRRRSNGRTVIKTKAKTKKAHHACESD
jgi:hypothetical protein